MGKKPSIIRRLLLLSVVVAMIPVLTSLFYFQVVIGRRLASEARRSVDGAALQIAESVRNNMQTLNNVSYYLMANDLAQDVMSDGRSLSAAASLERQIDTMMTYNDAWSSRFIQSVFLLRDDGAVFATTREGAYAGVRERNRAVAARNPGFSSTRTLLRPEGSPYCYYLQDYFQIDIQRRLGRLIIEVDPARLMGKGSLQGLPAGSQVFLVSEEGSVLQALGIPEDGGSLDQAWQAASGLPEGTHYRLSQPLGRFRMSLGVRVPYQAILRPVTASRSAYFLVQLAVFLLMIALIILIAARMRPQSRQLLTQMERLAQGDFSVTLPSSRYREYDLTARAFNRTTQQLGSLFERERETAALLSQAEYQMLESQINPHFIMNVLETINMRCQLAGQKQTADLVVSLGSLLSANVRTRHRQQITLREELEYVRYYLALQHARFDNLRTSVEVEDDALLDCLMPKLTIQPLVENSFVHGLEDRDSQGEVRVRCWEEDGLLLLLVKDNGKGFDPSRWQQPREGPSKTGSGIALYNINRRIQLLYGAEYGLRVESAPGRGASVWVSLPLRLHAETKVDQEEKASDV